MTAGLNYTAIDFETANSYRGSPCSVGLVKVRGGMVVDQYSSLLRPPKSVDYFSPWSMAIHEITPEAVHDAPRWKDALPSILGFIDGDPVVAHNAGFDIGVIRYACIADDIDWPAMQFLCTMVLARRALALPCYRLPYVAESLGYQHVDHHDALADARTVVDIVNGLVAGCAAPDLDSLAQHFSIRIGEMAPGCYRGSGLIDLGGVARLSRADVNPEADQDGYLYGSVVVFTGTLQSMTRQVAWDECSKIGALAERNVTRRSNVLVVGDINPAVLRPDSNITGRARKAFELQDSGQPIEVMTEDDFLRCLNGAAPDLVSSADTLDGLTPDPLAAAPRRMRSVPLDDRPAPTPPKPLKRTPSYTDQLCSIDGCGRTAAYKTRTNPTYCLQHINDIYGQGNLRLLEEFTRIGDWLLTECLICDIQAHYRFVYVLEKNDFGETVCRACFWRTWAESQRNALGGFADLSPIQNEEAKAFIEGHGFEYLGPLTTPSLEGDPHHTRCLRCGKISAERLGDISFGCTCLPRE